jgi:hypothetical protein
MLIAEIGMPNGGIILIFETYKPQKDAIKEVMKITEIPSKKSSFKNSFVTDKTITIAITNKLIQKDFFKIFTYIFYYLINCK